MTTPDLPQLFAEIAALHNGIAQKMTILAATLAKVSAAPTDAAPVAKAPAKPAAKAKPPVVTPEDHSKDVVSEDGDALAKQLAEIDAAKAGVKTVAEHVAAAAAPSVDDVRQALSNWAKDNGGNGAALKKLTDAGFKNCSTMPEDKRAAFVASLSASPKTAKA